MKTICRIVLLLMLAAALPGCGVQSVPGGTYGTLHAGDEWLSDVQVTVHQVEGSTTRAVGFGVTTLDGTFELFTNGAQGPLWLAPGEYRCTLESAGAPLQFPEEYARADTTPLKIDWSDADGDLDLEIPVLTTAR
jgi:hypothetical protein